MTNEKCTSYLGRLIDYVHSGVRWTSSKKQSACPHKQKRIDQERSQDHLEDGDKKDKDKESKKSYVDPRQEICPSVRTTCCYIKMQDPCRPCCCGKPLPPPCPPKGRYHEPREPVCGCDLCQKYPGHKCCDRNRAFRGIKIDGEYFEKA
ncbi:uncharacterized protein LOC108624272 [Ceratina calcarata]|uniref:Uncharacterized protein LOC108624272 n=1 Tax=Ceratina calcarata TaxID=156304 RepID=A0AAJ7RZS3_9HYME|nr:uncharacterized protein LOC108624272 [Ceratina calcarata]